MSVCFTAVLASIITVSRLQPSVVDIEHLKSTNAPVGCDGNSFIVRYLNKVLQFENQTIQQIATISDYPEAFKRGKIAAAFFVEPHAKVFLAKYCVGYIMEGPTYNLGGFGFVILKSFFFSLENKQTKNFFLEMYPESFADSSTFICIRPATHHDE